MSIEQSIANPIKHIQKSLPQRTAALIESPINRRYLTGFAASYGHLFVTQESAVFLTDSRYIEAAQAAIVACPVEEVKAGRLRELCKQHGVRKILLEGEATLERALQLQAQLPAVYFDLRSKRLSVLLRNLRACKSPIEIERIARAQRIAEAAFELILGKIAPGITERELALELDYTMLRGGAEALSFDTIVVAGENGSLPHGVPGERKLQRGDLITFDFGAVVDGYHSDMTRTVALGEPNAQQREIYNTVLRAQEAALACISPGVPCKNIDAAARDVIKNAGYGEHFRHATGHSLGLEVHEWPRISAQVSDVLQPGMVITVEPGIYLPGVCGVRIEDMAAVTETGCENRTKTTKELVIL